MNVVLVCFATVPMLLHRPTVRVRTFCDPTCVTLGGGALVFEVGYHPRKNVIRVIFQDQAMYVRTSFRSAKNVQNWGERVCFGHIDKFWKGHGGQNN